MEAVSKLTTIRVVGLCHGLDGGINQLSEFLEIPGEYIGVEGGGLNHFGFLQRYGIRGRARICIRVLRKKKRRQKGWRCSSMSAWPGPSCCRRSCWIPGRPPTIRPVR